MLSTMSEMKQQTLSDLSLPDGGQFYAETNPEHLIVEPWNALSSLLLILPALYWVFRLRGRFREHPFIVFCIPLLTLGGLGSTLFHAFRSSPFFLYLDVLPTAFLTLLLGVYFWQKVWKAWLPAVAIVLISLAVRLLMFNFFTSHTAVNISYAITGSVIFLPMLLVLAKTSMRNSRTVFAAIILLMVSLFFREMDAWPDPLLPMGTHFLWHAFSAAGAYYLSLYLFYTDQLYKKAKPAKA
jgi:hemolysin III